MNSDNLPSFNPKSNLVASSASVAIVYNPSGDYSTTAGDRFTLRVTVTNQGDLSALMNVYIDQTSGLLWEWCEQPYQQIALSIGESSEVVFEFNIPLTAIPDDYDYLVIVDAPKHYPQETPLTHRRILKVLSPVESVIPVKDPTFVLSPETTSNQPLAIQSGQTIEIQALVFNNTERVDRFRLRCLDIPADWCQIIYPEGVEELGLVVETKNLALNPNTRGKILIRITIPANMNAGSFTTSIQLFSQNNPELVLLNFFYFQVLPIYKLNFQLNAIVKQVSTGAGIYDIIANNLGNTKREIVTEAQTLRQDKLCKFTIEPPILLIQPEQSLQAQLQVQPRQWWRRPLFGKGMPIDFSVNFVDGYDLTLPKATLRGQLIWEARPWWHLVLLILAGVTAISTIVFLIWWIFFRPPQPPQIAEFASDSPNYQALNNDFIYLNWEIENAKQIRNIAIFGRNPAGQIVSRRVTYNFNNGLPDKLKPYCNFDRILICRNVSTDASSPGEYIFELRVSSNVAQQGTASQQTNLINIQPLPQPKIIQAFAKLENKQANLSPVLLTESSANATQKDDNQKIALLNFTINNWQQLENIQLSSRNAKQIVNFQPVTYKFKEGIPEQLKDICRNNTQTQQLECQNLPIKLTSTEEYLFELQVSSKASQSEIVDRRTFNKIEVVPLPQPQILSFNSTQAAYQENQNIRLNWNVVNTKNLGQIQLISRSPKGLVNVPLKTYNFTQGLPTELEPFCQLTDKLDCQFVPTNANQAGNYQFELTVIAKNDVLQKQSTKSDLIAIEAIPVPEIPPVIYPLQINDFSINNTPAGAKYLVTIDPQQPSPTLSLAWQVEASPQAKVELLPSPGQVPQSGSLSYPLSASAGQETLTLRVRDEQGKTVMRSVIIEKTLLPPPEETFDSQITGENGTSDGSDSSGIPQIPPEQPNQVPSLDESERIVPSDLPPQF